MKEYIFIHGKNASLSQYELQCVYEDFIIFQSQAFSIVRTDIAITRRDMDRLGGSIKICEVFDDEPAEKVASTAQTDKILFAVSQYGVQGQLSKVLMDIKRDLRDRGRNARFLNKDFANVSSGQLNQSKILEKGIDLVKCFYKLPGEQKGKEAWGQTLFFQDIDSYSIRDFEKPRRDMKVGMLPPKLAQMMINFARPEKTTLIYDPFCGLGTIPIEAALAGYSYACSDISGRMVESTRENIQWLTKKFALSLSTPPELIFQHDSTQSFQGIKLPKDLVVVTEGYLGPPLLRFPSPDDQKKIFELLHGINSKFLLEISQIITKGNRLVICCPFFRTPKEKKFYPEEYIHGYTASGFTLQTPLRSLLYERENQVVGREIMIFQKN